MAAYIFFVLLFLRSKFVVNRTTSLLWITTRRDVTVGSPCTAGLHRRHSAPQKCLVSPQKNTHHGKVQSPIKLNCASRCLIQLNCFRVLFVFGISNRHYPKQLSRNIESPQNKETPGRQCQENFLKSKRKK